MFDGLGGANPATDLDRQFGPATGDRSDGLAIDRLALEGAVEIDQVQATRAGFHPAGGHGHWIIAVGRGVVHASLLETHALAVLEIDGGNYQHVSVLVWRDHGRL
jgi:hypothetical protein